MSFYSILQNIFIQSPQVYRGDYNLAPFNSVLIAYKNCTCQSLSLACCPVVRFTEFKSPNVLEAKACGMLPLDKPLRVLRKHDSVKQQKRSHNYIFHSNKTAKQFVFPTKLSMFDP